jgi:hypothetical protein
MQLADLASDTSADAVLECARELAPVLGEDVCHIRTKIDQLVRAHRDEWLSFVSSCGANSFLAHWAELR